MVFKNIKMVLLSMSIMFIVGCGESNTYDGENGLITSNRSTTSIDVALKNIFDEVIYKDANETYSQSLVLISSIEELNTTTNETKLIQAQSAFKELVLHYKRVEAVYVAGYNSDYMKDIAEFDLEHYVKGSKSQDTAGDLDAVFAGTKSLVANSLKGITALEYTLFGTQEDAMDLVAKMNQNRLTSALIMSKKITKHLLEVKDYYKDTSRFALDEEESVSALLNVLVQQALNLKDIRIGEGAGLVIKYKDNPSATRLEYYYSSYSLEAIKEILQAYKRVIDNGLESIAELGSARSEVDALSTSLREALEICESYVSTLENEISEQKTKDLYEAIRLIQNNFTALIVGLNFEQDILEADGD